MRRHLPFVFLCFLVFYSPQESEAMDWSQTIGVKQMEVIQLIDTEGPSGISFERNPRSIEMISVDGVNLKVARFRGKSERIRGGSVVYPIHGRLQTAPVWGTENAFEILIPLDTQEQMIYFQAIDDFGKIYHNAIRLRLRVIFEPVVSERRWNFDLGAGLSYLAYHESAYPTEFDITELGVTVKAGANYTMSRYFEIGGNAFVTAYPQAITLDKINYDVINGTSTTVSGSINKARWFGINGRIGYRLPIDSEIGSYHVLLGWYTWGMLVPPPSTPDDSYGVQYLGGPQIFLTGRFRTFQGRASYAYLKFATIQDSRTFDLGNREFAVGGGYQISKPDENYRRWMLTLDIASVLFNGTDQSFTLLSTSLGLSTNI